MTDQHRDPEYVANARLVRAQVHLAWRHGDDVYCWRRGELLQPGQPFDVGHLVAGAGHARSNLAPECRRCNRSEGGRRGAAITNGRAARVLPSVRRASREGLAPW
ncbi:hypothetical protein [Microbacterium sp. Ag1]|uniref:hypothetical protein n=1 Tax=Microbacterium sp. Ag1 TaxID=1643443 RepID=UPI0006294EF2|nr:hypothetical protein [Microbacterium sp. Ag1]KKX96699.1 hypothetical protein AAY78_15380 [Microbacterium sp. Ag1]